MEVPDGLKTGDHLHVKVPYPKGHSGVVSSSPPDNLHRIIADNTNFFFGSETGHLMYPAFDIGDNLVSCWPKLEQQKACITRACTRKQLELTIILAPIFQLGFVLGQAYYRKENYTDLELPAAVNRLKEMLAKVRDPENKRKFPTCLCRLPQLICINI